MVYKTRKTKQRRHTKSSPEKKTRKKVAKEGGKSNTKKKQLKKSSKSRKDGGTGLNDLNNLLNSEVSGYLDNDTSALRKTSKNINNDLGNDCEGIDADHIGIKPPIKNPKMEVLWKTIPNPNFNKGSNKKCWKLKTLDELRDIDEFKKYREMFGSVNIYTFPWNKYHENPLAVIAIALYFNFYDFIYHLHYRMKQVLPDTELLEHVFHYLEEDGKNFDVPFKKQTALSVLVDQGYVNAVKALLNSDNVDVNLSSINEETPLFIAAINGNLEILTLLLSKNADVNKTNELGDTPLLVATINGRLEIVKALLNKNADVNKANKVGERPLDFAKREGHTEIENLIRQHGGLRGVPAAQGSRGDDEVA